MQNARALEFKMRNYFDLIESRKDFNVRLIRKNYIGLIAV